MFRTPGRAGARHRAGSALAAMVVHGVGGIGKSVLATQIAAVPQQIRGYGHIKDASVGPAKAETKRLWKQWETANAPEPVEA